MIGFRGDYLRDKEGQTISEISVGDLLNTHDLQYPHNPELDSARSRYQSRLRQ